LHVSGLPFIGAAAGFGPEVQASQLPDIRDEPAT